MNTKHKTLAVLAGLILLSAGIGLGRYSVSPGDTVVMPEMGERNEVMQDKKVLYWYDPMYPQQHFDEPGPSPFMDMALVPRYADDGADSGQAAVRVNAAMVQSLGIRSAPVVMTQQQSQLQVSGLVAFNDRALTRLQTPVLALVDKVWPLASGDVVEAGQPLVRLRVPDWIGAQHEWLAVLGRGDSALIAAGRERLLSLGMPASLIYRIKRERKALLNWTLVAPQSGVLRSLAVRDGMTLMAGSTVTEIQSLNPVWVEVAVAERHLQQVKQGDSVEVILQGVSPAKREGRVAEILPLVDPLSRTVQVRVTLANERGDLRPGMSAQVRIHGQAAQNRLAVPSAALLRTGLRTLVMLDLGEGRYQPREVQPGAELGEQTLIVAGLEAGQRVVVSGQFLLDSEASLQGIEVQALSAPQDRTHELPPAAHLHYAEGVVEQIGDSKVRLKHGPFESLSMPGMTMGFPLANGMVADGIAEGDRVRIGVSESGDGLMVELLEKQESAP